MRWMVVLGILMPAAVAQAQLPRETPAGLMLEGGGSVTRAPRLAVEARPGEVLLAGDVVTTRKNPLNVLSCADRRIVKLTPGTEATVTEKGLKATRGVLMVERLVAACFLPSVRRMPVAGPQHLGATSMRAGTQGPQRGTLDERVAQLGEPKAKEVRVKLAQIEGEDAVAFISRGAALEGAGLLADAREAYVKAAELLPDAAWLRAKVIEMDDALLKRENR